LKAASRSTPVSRNQRGRIWNTIASKKGVEEDSTEFINGMDRLPSCNCPVNVAQLQLPASSSQFLCWWRRCDVPSRLALMYKLGPAGLGHLFRIDIPTDLLGEIFHTLLNFNPSIEEIALVVALLEALTEVKRFTLGLQFLNTAERSTCHQLLQKLMGSLVHKEQDLAELSITEWTIQELAKKYHVQLQPS
jgi:Potential Monad-binding region of RPAP3